MKVRIISYQEIRNDVSIKNETTYTRIQSIETDGDNLNWVLITGQGNEVILSKKAHFIEYVKKESVNTT